MVFIFDRPIKESKRIDLALRECLGIGDTNSMQFYSKFGFNFKISWNKLPRDFKLFCPSVIEEYIEIFFSEILIELEYKNALMRFMKRIKSVRSYRSFRHFNFLPVRGQRTRTNAQTRKNKRLNRRRLPVPGKKKK